jgi:hypothetical protein
MEYLVVRFAGSRDVLINGVVSGKTNHVLQVVAGTYTISLGPPADFDPCGGEQIEIADTNPLEPKTVSFTAAVPA